MAEPRVTPQTEGAARSPSSSVNPSRVVEAMARAIGPHADRGHDFSAAKAALAAASDPALGEERLVRLGDVVEALRKFESRDSDGLVGEASYDYIARRVGGEDGLRSPVQVTYVIGGDGEFACVACGARCESVRVREVVEEP